MKIKAVFFDCWDTLIKFNKSCEDWNIRPIYNHCINKNDYDWDIINEQVLNFLIEYYTKNKDYEIKADSLINLLIRYYDMKLDCSIDDCFVEILNYQDPSPIDGVETFLKYLDDHNIYYAVMSNTIYSSSKTKDLLDSLIPDNNFRFFLGSYEIGVKKPNKLFFKVGAHPSGFDLKECCYIGDSFLEDVYGSHKAGFGYSIWLNTRKLDISNYEQISKEIDGKYKDFEDYYQFISYLESNKVVGE